MTPWPVSATSAGGELTIHRRTAGRALVLEPANSAWSVEIECLSATLFAKPADFWLIASS